LCSAVSIVDRYFSALAEAKREPPKPILMAITAVLIAAKIEQPFSPNF